MGLEWLHLLRITLGVGMVAFTTNYRINMLHVGRYRTGSQLANGVKAVVSADHTPRVPRVPLSQ